MNLRDGRTYAEVLQVSAVSDDYAYTCSRGQRPGSGHCERPELANRPPDSIVAHAREARQPKRASMAAPIGGGGTSSGRPTKVPTSTVGALPDLSNTSSLGGPCAARSADAYVPATGGLSADGSGNACGAELRVCGGSTPGARVACQPKRANRAAPIGGGGASSGRPTMASTSTVGALPDLSNMSSPGGPCAACSADAYVPATGGLSADGSGDACGAELHVCGGSTPGARVACQPKRAYKVAPIGGGGASSGRPTMASTGPGGALPDSSNTSSPGGPCAACSADAYVPATGGLSADGSGDACGAELHVCMHGTPTAHGMCQPKGASRTARSDGGHSSPDGPATAPSMAAGAHVNCNSPEVLGESCAACNAGARVPGTRAYSAGGDGGTCAPAGHVCMHGTPMAHGMCQPKGASKTARSDGGYNSPHRPATASSNGVDAHVQQSDSSALEQSEVWDGPMGEYDDGSGGRPQWPSFGSQQGCPAASAKPGSKKTRKLKGEARKAAARAAKSVPDGGVSRADDWADSACVAAAPLPVTERVQWLVRPRKRSEMPVVTVWLNDRAVEALVDTGATYSLLSETLARDLELAIDASAATNVDLADGSRITLLGEAVASLCLGPVAGLQSFRFCARLSPLACLASTCCESATGTSTWWGTASTRPRRARSRCGARTSATIMRA